jgi:hypothetical protein
MKQFELVLKNEKERSYKRISIILLILNLLGILFITYLKDFTKWGPLIIAAAAIFVVFASYYLKPKSEKPRLAGAFFLMFIAWLSTDYWMIGTLNIIFLFLNTLALQIPIVSISESQVLYPSFPKKKIYWEELNNLILKDGLLTIDFKSNKIIQQTIAEISVTIDEKEFNDFCKQQLNK